jgi:hypothetical protein
MTTLHVQRAMMRHIANINAIVVRFHNFPI